MSEWTSLNQIMRDLTVAQGNFVPAPIETFCRTEPPVSYIREETETEYNSSCDDADYSKPPDFHLIKRFLNLVTNDKKHKDNKKRNNNVEHYSNLSPMSPEFIPQSEMAMINHRAEKNVAITSILEARAASLLRPESEQRSYINMFQKKKPKPVEEKKIATVKPMQSGLTSTGNIGQYVPSTLANEYYNKYMSNAKLRVQLKEDIWTKAEREMKEKDERNKVKRARFSSSSQSFDDASTKSSSTIVSDLDYVNLLCHRHLLLNNPEECVVCNIAAKHGYYNFEQEFSMDTTSSIHSP